MKQIDIVLIQIDTRGRYKVHSGQEKESWSGRSNKKIIKYNKHFFVSFMSFNWYNT